MDNKHIVIIGLPGSGKSYLSEKYKSTHKVYDDFIHSFIDGRMLKDVEEGRLVCITDPRLCRKEFFTKYITSTFNPENTMLILFENDVESCIVNVRERLYPHHWINTVTRLSKVYDLNSYIDYPKEIIEVWKNVANNHK